VVSALHEVYSGCLIESPNNLSDIQVRVFETASKICIESLYGKSTVDYEFALPIANHHIILCAKAKLTQKIMLHAAGILINDTIILLLGPPGADKTTLLYNCLHLSSALYLGDDLLSISPSNKLTVDVYHNALHFKLDTASMMGLKGGIHCFKGSGDEVVYHCPISLGIQLSQPRHEGNVIAIFVVYDPSKGMFLVDEMSEADTFYLTKFL
jgi:hypothetical protein